MVDVICVGEALVDFVPTVTGAGLADAETYVRSAGGAPANVAVGVARLGVASGFMGMVGDDGFGRFLAATLGAEGVDLTGLRTTAKAPTALAAVSLRSDGDREFVFYGNPPAHALFAASDVDEAVIRGAKILHFGTLTLIDDPARTATLHAVDVAQRHGLRVSFDPNLRLSLWPDADAARVGMRLGLERADIVKISKEEVEFLAPDACDLIEGARSLWHPRLQLMAVTSGKRGCVWLDPQSQGEVAGFPVSTIDTTGAGDAFMAGLLAGLVHQPDLPGDPAKLSQAVRFANATGALSTMKRGAIASLPDRPAVERFLAAASDNVRSATN